MQALATQLTSLGAAKGCLKSGGMSNLGALASSSSVASAAAGASLVPCWKRSGGEHSAPLRRLLQHSRRMHE